MEEIKRTQTITEARSVKDILHSYSDYSIFVQSDSDYNLYMINGYLSLAIFM